MLGKYFSIETAKEEIRGKYGGLICPSSAFYLCLFVFPVLCLLFQGTIQHPAGFYFSFEYFHSPRLVNLTLGRAGFFYAPQAPTRRATSGTNRRSIGSAYHAKEKSRYGVVFPCGNLHPSKPLTSLFFGLFRLRRRNKKLSVFRSAVSASIIRKPLLKAPSPNLWNASEQVALRFSLCPC